MRFTEFYPDHLEEAMPQWAKKYGAAATLGLMAAAGGNVVYQGLSGGNDVQSMDQLQQKADDAKSKTKADDDRPKIKADPSVVQEMMALLKTAEGSALVREARAAGMKGRELAQFLAQCAHESLNFQFMKEMGDRNYFKRYDIRHAPERAKRLGNVNPGDGIKYIGRGFIQLTGRENYRRAGEALGLPLEERPELVERPDIAAKVAIWFWQHRVQPRVDDYSNTRIATKPINSGLKAVDDRDEKYKAIAHILGVLNWPSSKNR